MQPPLFSPNVQILSISCYFFCKKRQYFTHFFLEKRTLMKNSVQCQPLTHIEPVFLIIKLLVKRNRKQTKSASQQNIEFGNKALRTQRIEIPQRSKNSSDVNSRNSKTLHQYLITILQQSNLMFQIKQPKFLVIQFKMKSPVAGKSP